MTPSEEQEPRDAAPAPGEGPQPGQEPGQGFGDLAGEQTEDGEVEVGAAGGDPATADPAAELPDVDPLVAAHDEVAVLKAELAERTLDLQRLQAEFVNYKRRVDRDRDLVKENATYAALSPITEVLDTIDRAREHEELTGGFKSVVDQLERTVASAGLIRFGTPGDAFDPTLHEALSHIGEDPDVEVTTCKVIAKAGYRIGDRVVRAAQVLVVDPAGS